MTLKDVAKRAGVAVSTASRVINSGSEKCASKEVKERIWQAVKECGYTPNLEAQSLKKGKQNAVEKSKISILFARSEDMQVNFFFSELAEYIKQEVTKQGMAIGESYEISSVKRLEDEPQKVGKSDGIVVLGRAGRDFKNFLSAWGKNIIYITLNQMNINSDHVVSDGGRAAEIAMEHLGNHGHTKIAYIGEYLDEVRYLGYKNWLIKNKLPSPREYVINTSMTRGGGFSAVAQFAKIEQRPTAIFCANDVTAFGVIEGLEAMGLRVPEDISVVSIDNIKEAEQFRIPLSTVKIPLKEMGSFAVKTLKDRLCKGHKVPLSIFMPAKLVVRGSVRSVKAY